MKGKKSLKNAIFTSTVAFILCFAMLIGTTYAWFTDAVSSSGNIIKSGTLKIDVLVKGGDIKTDDLDNLGVEKDNNGYYSLKSAAEKNTNVPIFNYHLWEPGYTDWANVKVVNNGTLALKYTMRIITSGTVSALAEVIDVYYAPAEVPKPATRDFAGLQRIGTLKEVLEGGAGVIVNDHLLAGDDQNYAPDFATIVLHMQESAGNEYQNLEIGSYFELQILATQYTYESDSFDNMYDDAALFPVVPVNITESTSAGFHALASEPADVVISSANAVSVVPMNTTIVGAEDQNGAVNPTNSTGELTRTIDTDRDENSVTYDISYQYTTTEAGVSTTVDVTEFSRIVTNELRIEKDLKIVKVTHSHGGTVTEMTKLASADVNAEGYFYDHTTGILTIKSSKYSEFTVEFDRKKAVTTVTVEPGSVTMDVEDTADVTPIVLTPIVLPDDATYKTVTWSSSDPYAVSVNENGVIKAIKPGVYTVTATADGVSSSCTVTVYADAKIGDTYFAKVGDAFAKAQDHDTIELLRDTEAGISIHGINDLTFKMNGFTLTSVTGCAFTLYDCNGVTIENGTVNGQFRIGEHEYTKIKWKHLNYGDNLYEAVYGYHPLAPAKNVQLNDLTVNSGDIPAFYFTNIEDDLTRGAPSNYCDNNIYGHYIYKTGYTDKDQYIYDRKDEVFTSCNDKDSVVVSGGIYTGAAFAGNTVTYEKGLFIDGVLTVTNGMITTTDGAGRYVADGEYLVGTSQNTFTVSDTAPATYTAKTGSVYYTYAGGANDAVRFANIGETVYIAENANAEKEIGQDETFTVVSLADGVSWTGATVTSKVENPSNYEIVATADPENPLKVVYTLEFSVIARVYHVGDTRRMPTETTAYDEYGSLAAAVEAATSKGDYIMLMKDTTISEGKTDLGSNYKNYGINLSGQVAFDLNGHTYTYTGSGTAIINTSTSGTDGGQHTIRDSSADQTGTVYATNGYAYAKYNKKTEKTAIYGGRFISETGSAIYIKNANVFEISGGYFEGTTYWLDYETKPSTFTLSDNATYVPNKDAQLRSCFIKGTLITLADGSQKAIEELGFSDKILSYNFFNGTYESSDIAILVDHGEDEYIVTNLVFSDGTTLHTIADHGLFEYDLNKFVYILPENCDDYIGHRFVKYNGSGYTVVTLENAYTTTEVTNAYSITSAGNMNAMAESMLTVAPPEEFYNWIEMSGKLRYDTDKFEADVEKYGLYDYSVFADYVTYDQYVSFNGAYLKIPVEKEIFSFEYILQLIELYGSFMPQ